MPFAILAGISRPSNVSSFFLRELELLLVLRGGGLGVRPLVRLVPLGVLELLARDGQLALERGALQGFAFSFSFASFSSSGLLLGLRSAASWCPGPGGSNREAAMNSVMMPARDASRTILDLMEPPFL